MLVEWNFHLTTEPIQNLFTLCIIIIIIIIIITIIIIKQSRYRPGVAQRVLGI